MIAPDARRLAGVTELPPPREVDGERQPDRSGPTISTWVSMVRLIVFSSFARHRSARRGRLPCNFFGHGGDARVARRRSLLRLDADQLGQRCHLEALSLDGGGELGRRAATGDLPDRGQRVDHGAAATARISAAMRSRRSAGMSRGPKKPCSPSNAS
jgi:hypothetical protein